MSREVLKPALHTPQSNPFHRIFSKLILEPGNLCSGLIYISEGGMTIAKEMGCILPPLCLERRIMNWAPQGLQSLHILPPAHQVLS
jgi:hypothetical protein